jgi:uncharacterized protein (DUF362 family)/NAD-dependent dihydropyrimidine dehydrogenase PreA subunit
MRLLSHSQRTKIVTVVTNNSERALVAAAKAQNYNLDELVPAVRQSLELIGGLSTIVKPGDKVFIKINHLPPPSSPERGIVTHPIFTEAVIVLLKENCVEITVGDDIEESGGDGFLISGYHAMCERQNVKLVYLREAGFAEQACNGKILKNLYVSKIVLEADIIINLPKVKTHSLTVFTGGIKNMYGVIPSGLRRRFHGQYLKSDDFCQMLVDIYALVKPQLTIIDGITAMEGEGPGSGKTRTLGLVLASRDTVALDAVCGEIIGLKPADVLTTRYAGERGLGIGDLSRIDIVGEKFEDLAVNDFKLPVTFTRAAMNRAPHGPVKYILEQISPRPRVKKKNCTACGKCVKACPTGAATIVGENAAIDAKRCIRCMCCHEVCRFNAIYLGRPFFGKVTYDMLRAARRM